MIKNCDNLAIRFTSCLWVNKTRGQIKVAMDELKHDVVKKILAVSPEDCSILQ